MKAKIYGGSDKETTRKEIGQTAPLACSNRHGMWTKGRQRGPLESSPILKVLSSIIIPVSARVARLIEIAKMRVRYQWWDARNTFLAHAAARQWISS